MKKILLLLLISSSCFGYWPKAQIPTYREVEIRDVKEQDLREENERLRRENRNTNAYAQPNVVYVRPNEPRFELITVNDATALKYIAVGILLGWLILRK